MTLYNETTDPCRPALVFVTLLFLLNEYFFGFVSFASQLALTRCLFFFVPPRTPLVVNRTLTPFTNIPPRRDAHRPWLGSRRVPRDTHSSSYRLEACPLSAPFIIVNRHSEGPDRAAWMCPAVVQAALERTRSRKHCRCSRVFTSGGAGS